MWIIQANALRMQLVYRRWAMFAVIFPAGCRPNVLLYECVRDEPSVPVALEDWTSAARWTVIDGVVVVIFRLGVHWNKHQTL